MRALGIALGLWFLALAAWADARHTVLMDVLRIDQLAQILHDEGLIHGQELNADMLEGKGGAGWGMQVSAIHNPERISEGLRRGLEDALQGEVLETAIAFYASDLGQRVVELENTARIAMAEPEIEEAARARFVELDGQDDPRLALIARLIEAGDLITRNVTSGMNNNYQFMRGLADGDVIEMTEEDILAEILEGRDEQLEDTRTWLGGFMLMAYSPLSPADLEAYARFAESPAGRALNRGLFAGFDPLYEDISYNLGRAVALNMLSEEL